MDPNPYAAPSTPSDAGPRVVDRGQRRDLAALIRRFLGDEITAFEFDEALDDFRGSPDSAVRFVSFTVWNHYDDCNDHRVVLSKPEWDYFQRLLLLLESDCSVESTSISRWSMAQAAAGLSLGIVVVSGLVWGWGWHLLTTLLPMGRLSIGISRMRARARPDDINPTTYPFATLSELWSVYDNVGFRKARYPRDLESRTIRSKSEETWIYLQMYLGWIWFAPLVLALQALPEREHRVRILTR